MRNGNLLMSAVHFLFAVMILCASVFCLLIAHDPIVRVSFLSFLETTDMFLFLGIGGTGLGILLLVGLCFMYRGSFYQVKMDKHLMEIDPLLIQKYMQAFWKQHLPECQIESEILVHPKNKLEIVAYLKDSSSDIRPHLEKIEEDLAKVLAKQIGYQDEFLLTVVYP
jgi:hypothetical protein